ncbi:MAG TPA: hypothetical protein VF646_17805 [Cytophagales bacterium]
MIHLFDPFFPNDRDLLEALRNDDRTTWDRAYKRFKPRAMSMLKNMGASADQALTAYHDAWLVLDQKKHVLSFGPTRGKIRSYLMTAAKNKFFEILKRGKGGPPTISYNAGDPDEPLLPDYLRWLADEESPRLRNLFHDLSKPCEQLLEEAIENMVRAHCKKIIRDYYWHDRQLNEIARDVERNYGHIRERSGECIRDLRKSLKQVGYDEKCL